MLLKTVSEINRLDGEGLIPRSNRPVSWEEISIQLAKEAEEARDLFELGRVFKRLDATYPNLHAKVYLAPDLDESKTGGSVVFPILLAPQKVEQGVTASTFVISDIKKDLSSMGANAPQKGDRVVEINNIPIKKWTDDNFIFCKFPLREQCDLEFFDNFRHEFLGWNRHEPLILKLSRNGKEFSAEIPVEINLQNKNEEMDSSPCGVSKKRYPGFKVKYQGYNLCAFESQKDPSAVVLRIKSFIYDERSPFVNLPGEIEVFWNNYWRDRAKNTKNLIIDVISNYGGEAPIQYYELLFSGPFQEQYTQFKKISEFEKQEILESLFWGDKGKEIWFDNLKKDGTFSKTNIGDFFAPIPQFCANSKKDCREDLFESKKNGFKGEVKILVNHWCVSSCVGFVSNLVDVLGKRVKIYGIPDSGDSAYARLTLAISPSKTGVTTQVLAMKKARRPDNPEPWVRQVVAVTRSTSKTGAILSGKPQKVDKWVPKLWNQSEDDWSAKVLGAALKDN